MKTSALKYIVLSALVIVSCSVDSEKTNLSIVFTGDVILDRGVNDKTIFLGDSSLSKSMKQFLTGDFNLINLEGTLTNSKKSKGVGYSFKTDPLKTSLLEEAGVTHVSVANNHSYDFKDDGFDETIRSLMTGKITPIGKDCKPVIFEKRRLKVAVLATSIIHSANHLCINDTVELYRSVRDFEEGNSNIPLIIYVHWGSEYQTHPNFHQKKIAHNLIKMGVDAVIGHHPHVIQTIEYFESKPIFYSLGNFVADAFRPEGLRGLAVKLGFNESEVQFQLYPVDLDSYFPQTMSKRQQLQFFRQQSGTHPRICFSSFGEHWKIESINSIDFSRACSLRSINLNIDQQILLRRLNSGNHVLQLMNSTGEVISTLNIFGELKGFRFGDINNDGHNELLFGIVKKVNFDPELKLRLNIYQTETGILKPLWMGTKFLGDLETFEIVQENGINYLQTDEKDTSHALLQRKYIWDEFGFALFNE